MPAALRWALRRTERSRDVLRCQSHDYTGGNVRDLSIDQVWRLKSPDKYIFNFSPRPYKPD